MSFSDDFDSFDEDFWYKSDFTVAHDWLWTGWEADYVQTYDGLVDLSFNDQDTGSKNYTGAEVQSREEYGYGRFEVEMQPSGESGVVSSFFLFTSPFFGAPDKNEIDIEFLGNDTTKVNINYYYGDYRLGADGPVQIDLGFDAADAMHTYAIDWQPDSIGWYVDGSLIYEVEASTAPVQLPEYDMKIMMNVWTGSFLNWHGPISDDILDGDTTNALYSRVTYTADMGGGTGDGLPEFDRLGSAGNDLLKGSAGVDQINGLGGDDTVIGRGAADLLAGGAGDDSVNGGSGNDTLVYVIGDNISSTDSYQGGSGIDTLQIYGTADELSDPDVLADIAALNAFIQDNYDPDQNGGATFTLSGLGLSVRSTEIVETIVIGGGGPVNTAPNAVNDTALTDQDIAVIVPVLGNDTDPDGDILDLVSADQPSNGTVTINADNTVTYAPNAGFTGEDSFDYVITDGTATVTATVTVTVSPRGGGTGGDLPEFDRLGSSGDDQLKGGAGVDQINGLGGDDTVIGRGAADLLAGGAGDDSVNGGSGDDTLVYVIGDNNGASDSYQGSSGIDTLVIFGTADELSDPDVIDDIAALSTFMQDNHDPDQNGGATFTLSSLGLSVRSTEFVETIVIDDTPA